MAADIWVDLGLLTFARATVTLREGRLITKREALEVLTGLDAPADVGWDIYWARTYLREGIRQVLALA